MMGWMCKALWGKGIGFCARVGARAHADCALLGAPAARRRRRQMIAPRAPAHQPPRDLDLPPTTRSAQPTYRPRRVARAPAAVAVVWRVQRGGDARAAPAAQAQARLRVSFAPPPPISSLSLRIAWRARSTAYPLTAQRLLARRLRPTTRDQRRCWQLLASNHAPPSLSLSPLNKRQLHNNKQADRDRRPAALVPAAAARRAARGGGRAACGALGVGGAVLGTGARS